jgi:adenine-specific DNA methylase
VKRKFIQNDKGGKGRDFFEQGLARSFEECYRVLKDDGVMVFTFHHNKVWAWEGIGRVLQEAGYLGNTSCSFRGEKRLPQQ